MRRSSSSRLATTNNVGPLPPPYQQGYGNIQAQYAGGQPHGGGLSTKAATMPSYVLAVAVDPSNGEPLSVLKPRRFSKLIAVLQTILLAILTTLVALWARRVLAPRITGAYRGIKRYFLPEIEKPSAQDASPPPFAKLYMDDRLVARIYLGDDGSSPPPHSSSSSTASSPVLDTAVSFEAAEEAQRRQRVLQAQALRQFAI